MYQVLQRYAPMVPSVHPTVSISFFSSMVSHFGMWYFASVGPRNVYKDMLNNMVSLIDHVVMNHQNHTRTNGIWGHVLYICNLQIEEVLELLFLMCPFALDCWHLLQLAVPQGDPFDILSSFRNQLNVVFFVDIMILMCWSIWMTRNDFIFRGQ
jgi:hypothetical protein